ncbi:MAG TPA: NADH-quinone oxidoreductase subunit A [Myxococcaceae bacterium]|nr:NADH-quinone oxidoreductase subunit A [Myxococcaceae bacterium]
MTPSPLAPYLPIAIVLLLAGGMAVGISLLSTFIAPAHPTLVKGENFECGSVAEGSARQPFAVKFYVVALLFIVFDVEAVFLYPWAVSFRTLGWFGYAEMALFAATLVVGLVYVWKKGALNWES